jgi:hypothetical protein
MRSARGKASRPRTADLDVGGTAGGASAGYALGVARTHFRPGGHSLDLFSHGGRLGFLSDLFWLRQLQLGVALLTNSDTHDLQVALAGGIFRRPGHRAG